MAAALRYALIVSAVAAACYSFLLARAAWLFERDSLTSVPEAAKLVPYNSAYLSRLAAWRPANRTQLLERAVALNPFDFESLIQLGFHQEFERHDISSAEKLYLRAATVNRMFLPRWTLTNFYFRNGRTVEFFRWANAALAITPYSPEPIFVEMWQISQDAKQISQAVPDRPRVLLPYAWFLSNLQKQDPIGPVVARLIQAVGRRDPQNWGRDDLLPVIEDRLLAAGDRKTALQVWSSMSQGGWIRQSVPDVFHPVTNGNFAVPVYQHGFDWKQMESPGVHIDQIASDKLVRFLFSGDEPEQCPLIQQYIPLEAGRTYRLHWRMESSFQPGASGLRWTLTTVGKSPTGQLSSPDLAAAQADHWRFQAPAQAPLGLLTLRYARPLGQGRARGAFILRDVTAHAD